MSISLLSNLFLKLKTQYTQFTTLLLNNSNPKVIIHKKRCIETLFKLIFTELSKINQTLSKSNDLQLQTKRKESLDTALITFHTYLSKSIDALTYNIPFFSSSSASDKKFISENFNPKDLVNFAFRVSKQYKLPLHIQSPNEPQNEIPFAFLWPYPHESQEMKESMLKFDLSEERRLKPPIVEPPGGIVVKGTVFSIKYSDDKEKDLHEIFFKYTKSSDIIPSFFTGEYYDESITYTIDEACSIKVCACKNGFKDSEVVTYSFEVIQKALQFPRQELRPVWEDHNVVERPVVEVQRQFNRINPVSIENSPISSSRGGSSYQPSFIKRVSPSSFDDDEI